MGEPTRTKALQMARNLYAQYRSWRSHADPKLPLWHQLPLEVQKSWIVETSLIRRGRITPAAANATMTARRSRTIEEPELGSSQSVYFIQADSDGPIKIGIARNPRSRLASLQTSSPAQLILLASMRCKSAVLREAELHSRFASLRIRGEWFEPGEELISYIERLGRTTRE